MNMVVKAAEVQQAPIQIRHLTTPYKGLHGRPYCHNSMGSRVEVDLAMVGETHLMGQDEFQTFQVKVHGTDEGEGDGQILFFNL